MRGTCPGGSYKQTARPRRCSSAGCSQATRCWAARSRRARTCSPPPGGTARRRMPRGGPRTSWRPRSARAPCRRRSPGAPPGPALTNAGEHGHATAPAVAGALDEAAEDKLSARAAAMVSIMWSLHRRDLAQRLARVDAAAAAEHTRGAAAVLRVHFGDPECAPRPACACLFEHVLRV